MRDAGPDRSERTVRSRGPGRAHPQDLPQYSHRMREPAGICKRQPRTIAPSGLTSAQPVANQPFLDRKCHLSIFHEKLEAMVSGANSKRQPELATFRETVRGRTSHLPINTALRMETGLDRLSLAYNTFFSDSRAIQLLLRPGELLGDRQDEDHAWTRSRGTGTRGGRRPRPDRGWSLQFDLPSRLAWPVFPYSPYADAPKTSRGFAVGGATVPIRPQEVDRRLRKQDIRFVLEAAE